MYQNHQLVIDLLRQINHRQVEITARLNAVEEILAPYSNHPHGRPSSSASSDEPQTSQENDDTSIFCKVTERECVVIDEEDDDDDPLQLNLSIANESHTHPTQLGPQNEWSSSMTQEAQYFETTMIKTMEDCSYDVPLHVVSIDNEEHHHPTNEEENHPMMVEMSIDQDAVISTSKSLFLTESGCGSSDQDTQPMPINPITEIVPPPSTVILSPVPLCTVPQSSLPVHTTNNTTAISDQDLQDFLATIPNYPNSDHTTHVTGNEALDILVFPIPCTLHDYTCTQLFYLWHDLMLYEANPQPNTRLRMLYLRLHKLITIMKLFIPRSIMVIPRKPMDTGDRESVMQWQKDMFQLSQVLEDAIQSFIDIQFGINNPQVVHVIEEDNADKPMNAEEGDATMLQGVRVKTEPEKETETRSTKRHSASSSRGSKSGHHKQLHMLTRNAGSTFRRLSTLSDECFPCLQHSVEDKAVSQLSHLMSFPFSY